MGKKPRTSARLTFDDMREHERVDSRETRVIGNDDRPALTRNVLEPLDFDPEVTAKELKPDAAESFETAVFDEFYQFHIPSVTGHRATEKAHLEAQQIP